MQGFAGRLPVVRQIGLNPPARAVTLEQAFEVSSSRGVRVIRDFACELGEEQQRQGRGSRLALVAVNQEGFAFLCLSPGEGQEGGKQLRFEERVGRIDHIEKQIVAALEHKVVGVSWRQVPRVAHGCDVTWMLARMNHCPARVAASAISLSAHEEVILDPDHRVTPRSLQRFARELPARRDRCLILPSGPVFSMRSLVRADSDIERNTPAPIG
jgi:hypothetical protein